MYILLVFQLSEFALNSQTLFILRTKTLYFEGFLYTNVISNFTVDMYLERIPFQSSDCVHV